MRIYVGNLPYETTDSDLQALMSPHGTVGEIVLPVDRDTGRPKGFAFVDMPNDDEARAAITALNGKQQGSRTLTVNEARPKAPRQGGFGGGFGGGGGGRGFGGGGGGGGGGGRGGRDRRERPGKSSWDRR